MNVSFNFILSNAVKTSSGHFKLKSRSFARSLKRNIPMEVEANGNGMSISLELKMASEMTNRGEKNPGKQ